MRPQFLTVLLHASRRYPLTRNFALAGVVVIAAAASALSIYQRALDEAQLTYMSEQHNAALTRAFVNLVWPEFRDFVAGARAIPVEELRHHPRNASLGEALRRLMAETSVEKVKIYGSDGLTVYSTDPAQIGAEYADNPRFRESMHGQPASLIEFRERFGAFGGPIENRWILSSYVPVRSSGIEQPIEGVAEIYRDVTDQYQRIEGDNALKLALLAVLATLTYILLLAFVWHAERRSNAHHLRELELTAAVARVEASAKEKSTFLANMSHQLRTPLNAILGFAHMIAEERVGPLPNDRYKEYARDIVTSGDQLLGMINDVLLLVRIDAGMVAPQIERVDLASLAAEVVEAKQTAAAAAGVGLTIEPASAIPTVNSDEGLIRQVLTRLVDNAIKFTPRGGKVNLGFGFGASDGRISAYVADSGIGMRAEDIPAAMAPFGVVDGSLARRSETGVGLGLSLAGRLAKTAGAQLSIHSEIGAGTRVTLSFADPMAAEMRTAA